MNYTIANRLDAPLESTVLRLETDSGLVGWGETCTAPAYYLPTLASGARAAIAHVAPLILGEDPRQQRQVMGNIGVAMRGQNPAKSAIDMALWDLCGKAHGLPLVELWGGRMVEYMAVLRLVNINSPDKTVAQMRQFREQGYALFQIKVGAGSPHEEVARIEAVMGALLPHERCWFDVNRAWSVDQAMQVMPRVKHLGPLIEQPCESYRECLTLAAVSHIAQGIPAAFNFGLYDYHLPEVPVVRNPFKVEKGRVRVPLDCASGLGVEVDTDVVGPAVAEYAL